MRNILHTEIKLHYLKRRKFKIKDFELRYLLINNQKWLEDKEAELDNLIKECDNPEELKLIYNLLNRFTFLEIDDIRNFYKELENKILHDWKCDEDSTKIIGLSDYDEPDSSHQFIDNLKGLLSGKEWNNGKKGVYFTHFTRSFDDIKNQNLAQITIILIDEFIGSGRTIKNRLETLDEKLQGIRFEVKICVLACMKYSIPYFSRPNVELFCPFKLQRGIKDSFNNKEYYKAKKTMDRLESLLADKIDGRKLPNYGFGGAEALYVREALGPKFGNTPNSVFPIFWWPRYSDYEHRYPLLTRAQ